jgi:2-dehydropantoate 2-reductase
MRIAVAGAGAMGCRFGWRLASAGADVVLLDGWAEHVAAINDGGLRVVDEDREHTAQIPAAILGNRVEPVDLVLVFGKAMDTERIARACARLLTPETCVMTLQNGLGNIEVLKAHLESSALIAGTTTFSAELLGPGRIRALGSASTEIMALGDRAADALPTVAALMNAGGLNTRMSGDVMTTIWTKVAFNCVLNSTCTLLHVPVGALARYAQLEDVFNPIVEEVAAVAACEGVVIDRRRIMADIEAQYEPGAAEHHLPSMLVDELLGRPTEIEHLNGEVVRIAERHGVPVPTNRLIAHLVRLLQTTRDHRVTSVADIHRAAASTGTGGSDA